MLDEIDKPIVLLERLYGIRTRIRIGPFRLLDRPREKMLYVRIVLDQVP
jgi:hypothetical protein